MSDPGKVPPASTALFKVRVRNLEQHVRTSYTYGRVNPSGETLPLTMLRLAEGPIAITRLAERASVTKATREYIAAKLLREGESRSGVGVCLARYCEDLTHLLSHQISSAKSP